ncbi:MAG: heme-binding domain-containing protein, partial [Candidatus Obscuribacterales bacterium]|nr:heme-binding domain-containing protein [Candidatus Obscuribacterales bacterium]
IEADIEEAQKHLLISKRKLSGKERFTASEQAKIYAEIDEQKMPPSKYKLLHWNAGISEIDKEVILTWIKSEGASLGVKPIPAENPFKPEPKKATLGKKLFHDERLSGDNSVSCATCHEFDKGGSDQLKTSTGINGHKGPINSPTVFNAAFSLSQFWDGRSPDLKDQVNGPINNPVEMVSNWQQVLDKLKSDDQFSKEFNEVYPGGLTSANLADAIAEFEKTLITPNSRFDRYLAGDLKALSKDERKGYDLFVKNQCVTCISVRLWEVCHTKPWAPPAIISTGAIKKPAKKRQPIWDDSMSQV